MIKLLIPLVILSGVANAKIEKPFTIDNTQIYTDTSLFYSDENIRPQNSDFKVKSAITMSNEDGQRAVLLSIENLASGRRILEPHHLMATYADGSAKVLSSLPKKLSFKGGETINITVSLGNNLYPVISLVTSNNLR
ncbi:hypothetical protein A7985_24100 [Pseudoalteromonas luteoviolacea]|uniref:Copper chaperone PCu(A)C n=1 Tax=Pseudoalteromonas luteoviolacea TaxID=43657 RepID=A0A1C0TJ48_9GAMM|nr:hypothetical protein [Pseudoalteromonas luteoviolacea]OCQ18294.1 hypothetical protein A7985_24100 [Pseudoalteromonas luteoviolacea]